MNRFIGYKVMIKFSSLKKLKPLHALHQKLISILDQLLSSPKSDD
jgi:hypothetical protein